MSPRGATRVATGLVVVAPDAGTEFGTLDEPLSRFVADEEAAADGPLCANGAESS